MEQNKKGAQAELLDSPEDPIIVYFRLAREYNKKHPKRTFTGYCAKSFEAERDMDSNLMCFLPNHYQGWDAK